MIVLSTCSELSEDRKDSVVRVFSKQCLDKLLHFICSDLSEDRKDSVVCVFPKQCLDNLLHFICSDLSEDRKDSVVCEFSEKCLDKLLHFICRVMGFPVIRIKGWFDPEVPEPLPVPAASVIDLSSDKGNLGGEHVSGGFTLLSIHNTTMMGGGIVFALFIVALVVLWMCWRGHLQRCMKGCCIGCINQEVQRESQEAPYLILSAVKQGNPFYQR